MARSIKLQNDNYLDVDSIVYEHTPISSLIVVDSGTNSKGSYIKFGDGTMICSGKVSYTANGNFTQDSSIWFKNIGSYTFPAEFIEAPYINITLETELSTRRMWSSCNGVTKTGINNLLAVTYWNASSGGGKMHIYAIGKWK